jgi:hypothetical protein
MLAGSLFADPKTLRIPLIADARGGAPSTWHYVTDDPGDGWAEADFNDDAWASGAGGFGTGTVENSHIATDWSTPRIWLRTAFTLPAVEVQSLILTLHHDDDVQVFLNGQSVFTEQGFATDYSERTELAASDLKPGRNVLAIQCANVDGPGYIDAGLAVLAAFEATVLVGDARAAAPADWSYTTSDPGQDWARPDFDASAWVQGKAPFGTSADIAMTTPWADPDIWMRTTFTSASAATRYALGNLHDDGMEAYLNGTPILTATGWNGGYDETLLSEAARGAIVAGKNVLAVHCHNDDGPQFIDLGLYALESGTTRVRPRSRAPASGRGPSLISLQGRGVDLAGLAAGGRMIVFGIDGKAIAIPRAASGDRYLSLPVALGTGMFRYRWDFPPAEGGRAAADRRGSLQGTLLVLP